MILTPLSQRLDFKKDEYKNKGCGIACLGMFIGSGIDLDGLFEKGVESGAYTPGIGWRHRGLVELAHSLGFSHSQNHDLASLSVEEALETLEAALAEGPVIASVYTQYDPSQTEGHLVVLWSLTDEAAEVMDPAATHHESVRQRIPKGQFLGGWKKRFIAIRQ